MNPSDSHAARFRPERNWIKITTILSLVAISLFVFLIMSGTIVSVRTAAGFPGFSIDIASPVLFAANTPTGGDMGAHVLLPQVLRDDLLPQGRIMGWSPDWFAGFPVLYFYFPLPSLVIVALDVVLPYGVAFKLVTAAGLVAMPLAGYFLARKMRFSRMISTIAGVAGTGFIFMESFSIFGGNIKSSLAGEFSYSWSFALVLVYLGLVISDVREGRSWRPLPGIVLALGALSHIVPTIVVVFAVIPLLARSRAWKVIVGSWAFGFALSGFWSIPFLRLWSSDLTTNMNWSSVRGLSAPFPDELVPVMVVGLIGVMWMSLRRHDVMPMVWFGAIPLAAYFVLPFLDRIAPDLELDAVYNARFLPFWFFALFFFAGLAIGTGLGEVTRYLPNRSQNVVAGMAVVVVLLLNSIAIGLHDVPGWVRWNYTGYEGKAVFPEYQALMTTVDQLPEGRVMWEANNEQNKYGTPMALMLLPYWTEDHPSLEGLYFESSLTTPFHFLNAAEVSAKPSNPVRGLNYHPMDFERGLKHLALFDTSYYISYTETAQAAARKAGLAEVARAEPWTVFELPESSLVEVASHEPAVWAGEDLFFDAALEWYDDLDNIDHWLVEEGLAGWPAVEQVNGPFDVGDAIAGAASVTDVVVEDMRIEFTTQAIGVPHLVKVSYFPNWTATGAEGPFRAAPSFMVVVPTEESVVLEFGTTPAETTGKWASIIAIVGGIGVVWLRRRRLESAA